MAQSANSRVLRQTIKELERIKGKSETVLKRTVSDLRTRAPGWIAAEVSQVYGIKKGEITPSKAGAGGKKVGSIKATGETVDTLQIVYRGRVLTPTHFGMTPKAPKQSYTLKAEIIRGNKATLGKVKKLTKKQRRNIAKNLRREGTRNSDSSPIMLMRTGSTYIPFQRKSKGRKDVEAIKTLSLPQMVSSDRTKDKIDKALSDGLEKRLAQHSKLLER